MSGDRYYDALVNAQKLMIATKPSANDRQVGGAHYAKPIQHWDYVVAQGLGYFEGQITKYVSRWRDKGGIEDLRKARHFLDKLIEVEESRNTIKEAIMPEVTARMSEAEFFGVGSYKPQGFWAGVLTKFFG